MNYIFLSYNCKLNQMETSMISNDGLSSVLGRPEKSDSAIYKPAYLVIVIYMLVMRVDALTASIVSSSYTVR